jgi:two-component system cell cycle sensor histidine kinase/response regulator CckA
MEQSARILIVEDDAILVAHLEETLTQLGYAVCGISATGKSAIKIALEQKPDAVLMDIRLRGSMTGIEAAEEIHKHFDTPIIYLTAYSDEALVQDAKTTDAYAYLAKPVRERELRASMEMALYKHKSEERLQHLNQVLRAVRNINQLITREHDAKHLLEQACEILVQTRGYQFVWIGVSGELGLTPVAFSGDGKSFVDSVRTILDKESLSKLPGMESFRKKKPVVCRDILNDERYIKLRELAESVHFHSTAATPMICGERLYGILNVYADQVDCFGDDEIDLLLEFASDMAFGLKSIEEEAGLKRAEENLIESEERFRSLYENATIGLYRTSPAGKIILANPSIIKMLGYSSFEELAERNLEKEGYEASYERKYFIDQVEKNGDVSGLEAAWTKKDGTVIYICESAKAIRDSNGKTLYYDGTVEDITERKHAEDALRENENRMRMIIEGTPYLFFYTQDQNSKVTYISPSVEKITGHPVDKWMNQSHWFITDNKINEYAKERTNAHLRGELTEGPILVEVQHPDNYPILLEVYENPILLSGKVIGIQGVAHNITERKRAEESLKMWANIFEHAEWGVGVSSKDGKSLAALNPTFAKMHGYAVEELMGQPLLNLYPRDVHTDFENEIQIAQEKGHHIFESLHIRKDGTTFPVLMDVTVVKDKKGNLLYRIVNVQDITERKQGEHLRNVIYKLSQETAKAGMLNDLYKSVHSIVSTIMRADNFYIALYDEQNDLISFPYFVDEIDVPSPPHKPGKGLTEYVLRTGKSLLFDEAGDRNLSRQGEIELVGAPSAIWLGTPLFLDGKVIGVMVVQDYNNPKTYGEPELYTLEFVASQVAKAIQHKRAEKNIMMLSLAMEQSPASVMITDLNGKIEYVNPKFTELTGYGSAELLGQNPRLLKSDKKSLEDYKQLWETITVGKEWRGEFHNKKKNGEFYWESASIYPIKDASGKITNYLAVKEDITERKSLQKQLLRAQRMESIGTLAGGIAHDLNNVLAPILLSVEYLRKLVKDETGLRTLDILETSTRRGTDIIKQVLTFARGVEGEKGIVQLKHLMSEMVNIIRETFPKSIKTDLKIAKNLRTISGDATNLHQVLLNLCVNARDAMSEGGKLALAAENFEIDEHFAKAHINAKPGQYVVLSVSDTGTGIPQDVIDKIFDPFFTTKPIGQGTGLGLSTVHSIVKSHGGFINVYTETGIGTTFKIYLPAVEMEQAATTGRKEKEILTGNGELVLVVDDEASICEITHQMLDMFGYRVLTASNGAEALVIYKSKVEDISLVITDMMMPIMDGPQTIRELRKVNPAVKIIASSGLVESHNFDKSIGSLVEGVIPKPYSAEKLLKVVHSVLHK